MVFNNLSNRESDFRSKVNSLLTPIKVNVKNENLTLRTSFYKPNETCKYFFSAENEKVRIVLHFTAGSISSDIDTLTKENSNFISVPFVIARDGTIYQLFGSAAWARHLGPGLGNEKGMNNAQDKITIGIEISNYGYLIERNGNLETIYSQIKNPQTNNISPVQVYCSINDFEAYKKIDTPYRGQNYYATFTEQQYESVIILLRFLTNKYNIPRSFLPQETRFLQTPDVLNFKGIVSHVNYRKDKWDIGEAFNWDKLINGVQAAEYIPQFMMESATREIENSIGSEEEITKQLPKNPEPTKEVVKDLQDNQSNQSSKKLFGLLVGINEYINFPLNGCVNDMNNVKDYLEKKSGLKTHILTLTDKKATKKAIIDGFRKHLSKAKKDDTIVFYYSGHGTKENADPLWQKDSSTAGLECIVCHNAEPNFLMADKELRYLINELWKKTQAHIVVITDCCHSGDNTRGEVIKHTFVKAKEKRIRLSEAFPIRKWKDFVFSDKISFATAQKAKAVADFLPEGNHIQLAACESDESALEVNGNGVFTTNLLKVLENCNGNISYQGLSGRIRSYMKVLFEQKPRIYSVGKANLINTIFLNKGIDDSNYFSEIQFNQTKGWELSLGAIHGVKQGSKVSILDDKTQIIGEGKVSEVYIDYSILESVNGIKQDKNYKVNVSGVMTHLLSINVNNFDTNPNELAKFMGDLQDKSNNFYELKADGKADYSLYFKLGKAYITKFGEEFKPLCEPLTIKDPNFATTLSQHIKSISRWHYLENLKNENTINSLKNSLKVEVYDENNNLLSVNDEKIALEFEKTQDGWEKKIKVQLTNQGNQKIYVCVAYLSLDFGVSDELLPQNVQLIEPQQSINLQYDGESVIPWSLGDVQRQYNWERSIERFVFIISNEIFDSKAIIQEGLPRPTLLEDLDPLREEDRALGSPKKINKFIPDWTTQKLIINFKNPEFDNPNKEEVKMMLEFDKMAEFALGNFYDVKSNGFGAPIFTLKEGIKKDDTEKSFFNDLIMNVANKIENQRRLFAYNQIKDDRMRIVAEGDSWFLYPFMLKEIIDQISPLYAIRSLAAAGDELQNYMKEDNEGLTQFERAIRDEKPKLFLVSGGGNDIVGEELQQYLKKNNQTGRPAEEYIKKQEIDKAIENLGNLYRRMFQKVKIPIIVHGYDYIFPIDFLNPENQGKQSWAGRYMFDNEIKKPSDQRRIIIYLIDKFNELLKKLDDEFAHVHYVNGRNSVPNQEDWFDEIHPQDVGFNRIAIKFIDKINELIEKGEIVV